MSSAIKNFRRRRRRILTTFVTAVIFMFVFHINVIPQIVENSARIWFARRNDRCIEAKLDPWHSDVLKFIEKLPKIICPIVQENLIYFDKKQQKLFVNKVYFSTKFACSSA